MLAFYRIFPTVFACSSFPVVYNLIRYGSGFCSCKHFVVKIKYMSNISDYIEVTASFHTPGNKCVVAPQT